ncbi:MAG: O-antigen ligase family protein [Pseudomonadota bacterium]
MPLPVENKVRILAWLAFLVGFGLPISTAFDNLAAGALLLGWAVTGNWKQRWQRLRSNPASYAVGCLLLLAAVGMAWSQGGPKENLRYFEKYAALFLTLCLFTLPFDRSLRQMALRGFACAAFVTAIVSFGFKFGIVPPSWFPQRLPSNPAVFKLHITHGFFVAIGGYFLMIEAMNSTDRRWRFGFGLAALLTAGNALVIEGRTGYVVLAALFAYLFIQRFRWRGAVVSVLLLATAVLVAQQFPDSAAMRRMATGVEELKAWQRGEKVEESSSMGVRMQFATTSLNLISAHPLLGVGTGGFEVAYRAVTPEGNVFTNNPHNQYLLTTVQLGLVGLVVLLALFIVLWRVSGHFDFTDRLLARGVLLAYLVGNLFNSFLYDHSEARFFAWAVGLIFCGTVFRAKAVKY